jgi:peptidyl-prolyl cis-trans isomerase D
MQVAFSAALLYRFQLRKESPTVLNAMRKSADSFVLKSLFVIIVLVFMFWGVGTMRANRMEWAARVNDEVITQRQFDTAFRRMSAMYQNMGQQSPPAEFVRAQALDQLVDLELLNQEADRLGLMVDEAELREAIKATPDFLLNGVFDKDHYVQVLQQNDYKPSDFEQMQRRRMVAGKVQGLVRSGVHVSDQELQDRYRYENERVNLRFVRVPAKDFLNDVALTDEDLQKYFSANQEKYREPERVRIKLVEFRPQDFSGQAAPTDEEVQAYYTEHAADYQKPEEVHARHILFKLPPNADDAAKAAARKQAEDVLAKAKGGADFAELAKQYSQDSTAEAGGDLGKFGRGVMTPTFEAAAFALEPGGMSDIVESPFGLHIIKVEEKTAASTQPVEAVRDGIVETLKTQQGRQLAMRKVEEAHDQLLDGKELAQVATDNGLTVQTPPPFANSEPIGGLGLRPELAKEAFNTDTGEIGEIVTEPTGYSILSVEERLPSAIPDFATARPRVDADLRRERAAAAAKARAEELLGKLKEQRDLDALAQKEGLKVEQSDQIARVGGYLPNLGSVPALKDAAFRLTPEAPVAPEVYTVNGDAVLAVLAAKTPADDSRFETDKAALRQRIQQQAEGAAVQRFLDQLKTKAQVVYGHGFAGMPSSQS